MSEVKWGIFRRDDSHVCSRDNLVEEHEDFDTAINRADELDPDYAKKLAVVEMKVIEAE